MVLFRDTLLSELSTLVALLILPSLVYAGGVYLVTSIMLQKY